jgi:hypothetical protein
MGSASTKMEEVYPQGSSSERVVVDGEQEDRRHNDDDDDDSCHQQDSQPQSQDIMYLNEDMIVSLILPFLADDRQTWNAVALGNKALHKILLHEDGLTPPWPKNPQGFPAKGMFFRSTFVGDYWAFLWMPDYDSMNPFKRAPQFLLSKKRRAERMSRIDIWHVRRGCIEKRFYAWSCPLTDFQKRALVNSLEADVCRLRLERSDRKQKSMEKV